ncbi:MAG: non-homologous end-joining DNA ligase [Phaeodactylibacter sp.]|nr:non-homologous end-joining DNA ligase [Phaeodactylibacter sp.]
MKFEKYSFEPSKLDKVLFPKAEITKKNLIDYYSKVSEYMLPHLKGRPLAMHRFPDGINGKAFFQKEVPDYFPEWVDRAEVERKEEGPVVMVVAKNAATLAYLANQACIAIHAWPARRGRLNQPDKMVFDLDPPAGRFDLVIKAARILRGELEEQRGLPAFVMTSGSEGLHVVVPLRPEANFDAVRDYARKVCEILAEAYPDDFTTETRKEKRRGRLFLDYLRNSYGQHSIAPYSVRAIGSAPVATPLDWKELERLDKGAQSYAMNNVFRRLGQKGDPWKGMWQGAPAL